jgi:hypothetical protein
MARPAPKPDPFLDRFRGRFTSLLSWESLDNFWVVLRAQPEGWYLYAVGEAVPESSSSRDDTLKFIDAVDALLRKDHHEDYCGIVYADDAANPSLIKIYDPQNLGVSCGFSTNPPMPGWIMSRLPPVLIEDRRPLPEGRRRWWRNLWDSEK